jgi:multicomponent Na+:H+ antiporter subunit D
MNPHLIILFVALPMATGLLSLLLHGRQSAQRAAGVAGLLINLAMACYAVFFTFPGSDAPSLVLASQMGNWPAPFGITVVVDGLAACMLAAESLVALCVFIYCITQLGERHQGGFFHPLFHLLILGVQWAFITGDLFNLFVAFEVMLMASYALFIIGVGREQIRQASKYIVLNLIGSSFFVVLAGLLYGQTGTLNMAHLAQLTMAGDLPPGAVPVVTLFLLVFGAKSAMFPLWYWLPETYPAIPAPLGALLGGLLTKVGVYVVLRVFVLVFGASIAVHDTVQPVMFLAAGVGFIVGGLGAVSMNSMRQIFAISILSQVAYMVLGAGLGTTAAVAGVIFFVMHNMIVKSSLFLTAGLVERYSGNDRLERNGGMASRSPALAAVFLIGGLALGGIPPLSGFFGKLALLREAFALSHHWLAAFAMVASLLSLLAITRIWAAVFWGDERGYYKRHMHYEPRTAGGLWAAAMLVGAAVLLGLLAQPMLEVVQSAARVVVERQPYVDGVLGGTVSDRETTP